MAEKDLSRSPQRCRCSGDRLGRGACSRLAMERVSRSGTAAPGTALSFVSEKQRLLDDLHSLHESMKVFMLLSIFMVMESIGDVLNFLFTFYMPFARQQHCMLIDEMMMMKRENFKSW